MFFFKSKRGISPLIATVLLIGFTVALAAVVITWGSGFVNKVTTGTDESTSKTVSCTTDLNFQIRKVSCPDKILIDNKGEVPIESLNLRFLKDNGDIAGNSVDVAGVDKSELKTIQTQIPLGTNKIEALATVKINGQNVVCSSASREKIFSPCAGLAPPANGVGFLITGGAVSEITGQAISGAEGYDSVCDVTDSDTKKDCTFEASLTPGNDYTITTSTNKLNWFIKNLTIGYRNPINNKVTTFSSILVNDGLQCDAQSCTLKVTNLPPIPDPTILKYTIVAYTYNSNFYKIYNLNMSVTDSSNNIIAEAGKLCTALSDQPYIYCTNMGISPTVLIPGQTYTFKTTKNNPNLNRFTIEAQFQRVGWGGLDNLGSKTCTTDSCSLIIAIPITTPAINVIRLTSSLYP